MASIEPTEGRCAALIRKGEQAGMYCTKPPMIGQTRCDRHGGKAPQNLAAAKRRRQELELARDVVTLGVPIDTTAEEAIQHQLRVTAGHCAWLLARVQDLEPDALIWGRTSEQTVEASQFPGVDTTREAVSHVWLATYERHLKIHLAVVDIALKHKLGERMVQIAEREGAQLAQAGRAYIAGVIDALGLDAAAAAPIMQRLFAEMLRSLAGGPLQVTA